MKKLLGLMLLTGCATTSSVQQAHERIEEVRLEQQVQFCTMSIVPCILVTQDKANCRALVHACTLEAIEVYKKNTGKSSTPASLDSLLNEVKQAMKPQQNKPDKNGLD
jgi:hypothetical protein